MTPEEKIKKEINFVVKKIKEEELRTKTNKPVAYRIKYHGYKDPNAPLPDNEERILEKLEDFGITKILKKNFIPNDMYILETLFYIKVLQPNFNEYLNEQLIDNTNNDGGTEKINTERGGKKQKPVLEGEPISAPRFRFNQGVLFRDFCNEVLIIKGENTQEYRLLDTTIALPVRERIDVLTENIEMEWRQLYDTARRLNDKIKYLFKIDGFFHIDFQNKKLHRTVE